MSYIPPSGLLGTIDNKKVSSFNKRFQNTPLRMGVIVKSYDIDDENSKTKIVPEYDVVTSELNADLGQSFVEYQHCVSTDTFGGVADFFEYKLRPSEANFKETYDLTKQNGSTVLMLCMDGFSESAVIIGGVRNTSEENDTTTLTKENGLHMEGEYNGLNWQVNKDGEFTITFKSKTDVKGKPQDSSAGGSFFKIDKKGSIDLDTDSGTSIKIDKSEKDIKLEAGNNIGMTAKGDIEIDAIGDIKGSSKGDMEFDVIGSAKFSSKSSIDIEGLMEIKIKSLDISIEAQSMLKIKTTMLNINSPTINVTSPSVIINSAKIAIGAGPSPAVTAQTKFIGVGFGGVAVISSAMGPFSQSVLIGS